MGRGGTTPRDRTAEDHSENPGKAASRLVFSEMTVQQFPRRSSGSSRSAVLSSGLSFTTPSALSACSYPSGMSLISQSNTFLTLCAMSVAVNGLPMKCVPSSTTPWWMNALSA
jgi:hypothetical protein